MSVSLFSEDGIQSNTYLNKTIHSIFSYPSPTETFPVSPHLLLQIIDKAEKRILGWKKMYQACEKMYSKCWWKWKIVAKTGSIARTEDTQCFIVYMYESVKVSSEPLSISRNNLSFFGYPFFCRLLWIRTRVFWEFCFAQDQVKYFVFAFQDMFFGGNSFYTFSCFFLFVID